jgi:thiamine-monophosphate kinase
MELDFIAWLKTRLAGHPQLLVGPGDDAAVLRLAEAADCVVTTDLVSDGVDFVAGRDDPRRIGRKALAVNLSDLAAMAARPLAGVVALLLPREGGASLARELYEGLLPLAQKYHLAIAGGDTNSWAGPLAISVTLVGQTLPAGPLLRSGARPGDWIVVTGRFGGSLLGRHFDFEPRVEEAIRLREAYELHAGIDVSDGLSLDLARLAEASGCGAVVDLDRVPISDAARELSAARRGGPSPLEHALGDGEDFELVLAMPPDEARRAIHEQPLAIPLTAIGEFAAEKGLFERGGGGAMRPLAPRGYEHKLDP